MRAEEANEADVVVRGGWGLVTEAVELAAGFRRRVAAVQGWMLPLCLAQVLLLGLAVAGGQALVVPPQARGATLEVLLSAAGGNNTVLLRSTNKTINLSYDLVSYIEENPNMRYHVN